MINSSILDLVMESWILLGNSKLTLTDHHGSENSLLQRFRFLRLRKRMLMRQLVVQRKQFVKLWGWTIKKRFSVGDATDMETKKKI